jgi:rhamnose transport system ATP-binding protein
VVILDEPTAALSQHEILEFYQIVERLKQDGKAILFISHKFDEIFELADTTPFCATACTSAPAR